MMACSSSFLMRVKSFVPSLSIVDVVANLGWAKAGGYVRAGG